MRKWHRKLASILQSELPSGQTNENSLNLCVYLCNALGEFTVPDGLPALLAAAAPGQTSKEIRFAAIKALAVYLSAVPNFDAKSQPNVIPAILEASRDTDPLFRSTAAFASGALTDNQQATTRLKELLSDADPNVRYNAATTLARRGDLASVNVLATMLALEDQDIPSETKSDSREAQRGIIVINALRATAKLAEANPSADLSRLRDLVVKLKTPRQPERIQVTAAEVLHLLDRHAAPATAHP